jgi:hypothetical protein
MTATNKLIILNKITIDDYTDDEYTSSYFGLLGLTKKEQRM